MKNNFALCLLIFIVASSALSLNNGVSSTTSGTEDGSERWGYVEVRPKAFLFWCLYTSPYRVEDSANPWPTILWLQGGPEVSGVAFGNFLEIGPLDGNLQPRNSTWLHKADLLFVDNPVGTGFSYVEDKNKSLAVKTDDESATDLTTLLISLFNGNEMQKSPLYIFAESYGGKFAATLGVSALKAIETGDLKMQLGGIALGDSWISPEDFVLSWEPLLKDVSRLNENGLNASNSVALKIQQQIEAGQYEDATNGFFELENVIFAHSNNVDMYNFLLHRGNDPTALASTTTRSSSKMASAPDRYSTYFHLRKLFTSAANSDDLSSLMNGPIKRKLKIIPKNVEWGGQDDIVFPALAGDFMRPRIQEVDELLSKGINVTIYNGQVDVICARKGTDQWMKKLKWDGLEQFLSMEQTPLFCANDNSVTKGFVSSYKNVHLHDS